MIAQTHRLAAFAALAIALPVLAQEAPPKAPARIVAFLEESLKN